MSTKLLVYNDPTQTAEAAAALIAQLLSDGRHRGDQTIAFSGGSTPGPMFDTLATTDRIDWSRVHITQVDERVAPAGSSTRNLTELTGRLISKLACPEDHIHPMPVEDSDLVRAAGTYAETLRSISGEPPVIDIVHLGLGSDGHTASLVPNDGVLDVQNIDVALTSGEYQGTRRMTLTYPIINRARVVVWLAAGDDKAEQVKKLLANDESIPAGRIRTSVAYLFVDKAAGKLV